MFRKNRSPLTIYVTDTDWRASGDFTIRTMWLYRMLEREGGISASVPPGTYHYTVKRVGFKLVTSLAPVED